MTTMINDDSPASTPMSQSLAQRRRDVTLRCTQEAQRAGTMLMFGMATSLMLQSVPLPEGCLIDADVLHTVSSCKARRMRIRNGGALLNHVWGPLPLAHNVRVNRHLYALDLFHTWAQLSPHMPLASLIALGDSIVTALSRTRNRPAAEIHRDFVLFLPGMPKFKGKTACVKAMTLIRPNVDSPKETETHLGLLAHGLPESVANFTVPGLVFGSGVPMTLDMAWPEQRVAVEYDGDQHRTDKAQWRRDQEKRDRLRAHDWHIAVATGATLASGSALAEFAFRVARELTLRGAEFTFRVTAMPLEQVIHAYSRR